MGFGAMAQIVLRARRLKPGGTGFPILLIGHGLEIFGATLEIINAGEGLGGVPEGGMGGNVGHQFLAKPDAAAIAKRSEIVFA
jgi:hypothetical protein